MRKNLYTIFKKYKNTVANKVFKMVSFASGDNMINTTLCYICRGSHYLMLHRTKKENDLNHDKWIGIGGKFLEDESPDECLLRETLEETGLTLTSYRYRGIVTFVNTKYPSELMHLFTADGYTGALRDCDEGVLEWIDRDRLSELTLWEGDKIFLDLLRRDTPFFSLKLRYDGDTLLEAVLDGKPMQI